MRTLSAYAALALAFATACNEGHPELKNAPAPPDASTLPDLAPPPVMLDMTSKSCGQLALCVIMCGQDLTCYAGCGMGASPQELIAAVSLGVCAFTSCLPRGDGGAGGIIGGGTGGGTGGLGGGLGGIDPVQLFGCLGQSCSSQLSMCDGLLGAFGGFGGGGFGGGGSGTGSPQ